MEEKNSRRRTRKIITLSVIVAVIILVIVVLYIQSLNCSTPSEEVVKCISSKATLYMQEGCSHCLKQEKEFGECYVLLNATDCTKTPEKCIEVGIRVVPTWIVDGKLIEGVYKIEELQEITNCGLMIK